MLGACRIGRFILKLKQFFKSMAQYVYSMMGVGKVVPPKKHILKDISLSFFPGAKIGVLGLNGSGKSTVLRIMAGLDDEFVGEIVDEVVDEIDEPTKALTCGAWGRTAAHAA